MRGYDSLLSWQVSIRATIAARSQVASVKASSHNPGYDTLHGHSGLKGEFVPAIWNLSVTSPVLTLQSFEEVKMTDADTTATSTSQQSKETLGLRPGWTAGVEIEQFNEQTTHQRHPLNCRMAETDLAGRRADDTARYANSQIILSDIEDLQEIVGRFDSDEEVVVDADKKIYVQANNGKKALNYFHKNWQAQVGINTLENTKKPGIIAKGSVVSEKPGASTKREED
ncbi:uncharacterized protein CCOS01_00622 [Colletotrichum costaricense]|uniref:Uncharacterized protein n=1 Tax=Colletotrichum costaricense TaxID=1209916 RepID=A0AAI9Z9E4_9PEZI|nr:uncharacterized protein CCOS01_00622 [Colletotrichum costaricense]KAK1539308.1 hypothetical protein CCOS01_00622 [Colletotrichum costaricense]